MNLFVFVQRAGVERIRLRPLCGPEGEKLLTVTRLGPSQTKHASGATKKASWGAGPGSAPHSAHRPGIGHPQTRSAYLSYWACGYCCAGAERLPGRRRRTPACGETPLARIPSSSTWGPVSWSQNERGINYCSGIILASSVLQSTLCTVHQDIRRVTDTDLRRRASCLTSNTPHLCSPKQNFMQKCVISAYFFFFFKSLTRFLKVPVTLSFAWW